MKNIARVLLVFTILGLMASCSGHEKCPTYNGKINVEQTNNI